MQNLTRKMKKSGNSIFNREKMLAIFGWNFEFEELHVDARHADAAAVLLATEFEPLGLSLNAEKTAVWSPDAGAGTLNVIKVLRKERSEYWIEFSPQTSRGSFSAVSTPIFASKYALESSRRDLHNPLLCTVLQSQFFRQKSPKLFRDWLNEYSLIQSQTLRILHFLARIFDEFFSGFRAKFQKIVTCVAFSIKFAKTNQKFAENSEFCEKKSLLFWIIHFTPY